MSLFQPPEHHAPDGRVGCNPVPVLVGQKVIEAEVEAGRYARSPSIPSQSLPLGGQGISRPCAQVLLGASLTSIGRPRASSRFGTGIVTSSTPSRMTALAFVVSAPSGRGIAR